MTMPLSSVNPPPGSWEQIAEILHGISQDVWSAGWLIDVEHLVWAWMSGENKDVPPEVRHLLPELADLAREGGHWVRWDDRREGHWKVVPVQMDRWERQHVQWRNDHPTVQGI